MSCRLTRTRDRGYRDTSHGTDRTVYDSCLACTQRGMCTRTPYKDLKNTCIILICKKNILILFIIHILKRSIASSRESWKTLILFLAQQRLYRAPDNFWVQRVFTHWFLTQCWFSKFQWYFHPSPYIFSQCWLGLCNITGLPVYCNIMVSNTYCNTFFRIAIRIVFYPLSYFFLFRTCSSSIFFLKKFIVINGLVFLWFKNQFNKCFLKPLPLSKQGMFLLMHGTYPYD